MSRLSFISSSVKATFSLVLGALVVLHSAQADDAGTVVTLDHATLRLAATAPDGDGRTRGAFIIDLEPGWKTYWIDPGEAGIPPMLDFSGSVGLSDAPSLRFPVPHRFDDGFSTSVGYDGPVAIAFETAAPVVELRLRASLGVCREICIPVTAELASRPGARPADAALVRWAFAALPSPAAPRDVRLTAAGNVMRVAVRPPAEAGSGMPELFLAGPSGWNFGVPAPPSRNGAEATFAVPVLARPPASAEGEPPRFTAVLSSGEWAAEYADVPVDSAASAP